MIFFYTQTSVSDLTSTGDASSCSRWENIQRPRLRQNEERERDGGAEFGKYSSKRNASIKSLQPEFREQYIKGGRRSRRDSVWMTTEEQGYVMIVKGSYELTVIETAIMGSTQVGT